MNKEETKNERNGHAGEIMDRQDIHGRQAMWVVETMNRPVQKEYREAAFGMLL
jgi:hypothetical protein